jgi:hypothetical protein
MEFANLTPFAAMAYSAEDTQARAYRVVVARVVYQLVVHPDQPTPGITWCEAQVIDENAPELITEDQFTGEAGYSDLLAESDLSPYKPRCDVLVTGHSYAPAKSGATHWQARLRFSVPALVTLPEPPEPPPALNPLMGLTPAQQAQWKAQQEAYEKEIERLQDPEQQRLRVLIDKTLTIHGPRQFDRGLLGGWSLTAAQAATQVPLSYTLSYGGTSQIKHPQYGQHSDAPEYLLNEVCYTNPLGTGWQHTALDEAYKRAGIKPAEVMAAPQIEYPDHPVKTLDVTDQAAGPNIAGMARIAQAYRGKTAGFGPLGRTWTPRVQHTGTYNQRWLDERWPHLPQDFDFSYWNCAPRDQQIPFPHSQAIIELGNLSNPKLVPGQHIMVELPGH